MARRGWLLSVGLLGFLAATLAPCRSVFAQAGGETWSGSGTGISGSESFGSCAGCTAGMDASQAMSYRDSQNRYVYDIYRAYNSVYNTGAPWVQSVYRGYSVDSWFNRYGFVHDTRVNRGQFVLDFRIPSYAIISGEFDVAYYVDYSDTRYTSYSDGSTAVTTPGYSNTVISPDGRIVIDYSDGSQTVYDPTTGTWSDGSPQGYSTTSTSLMSPGDRNNDGDTVDFGIGESGLGAASGGGGGCECGGGGG